MHWSLECVFASWNWPSTIKCDFGFYWLWDLLRWTNKEKYSWPKENWWTNKKVSSQSLMLRCEMRGNERQWEAMRGNERFANHCVEPALVWFQGRTRHNKFAVIKWCKWSNDDQMMMMIKWWSNDANDANDQDKSQMIIDKGHCRWDRKLMPPSVISPALFVIESWDKLHQVNSDIANDGWPEKASEKW